MNNYSNKEEPGPSNNEEMTKVWKKFWKINFKLRVKVLCWKILQNTMPVRRDLNSKNVMCIIFCPMCLNK